MTYLIIGILFVYCIHISIKLRRVRKEEYRLHTQRVRFLEVSRYCAFIDCNPVDIEYFMDYKLTWAMSEWARSDHRDPLIIDNFREYCKSRMDVSKCAQEKIIP